MNRPVPVPLPDANQATQLGYWSRIRDLALSFTRVGLLGFGGGPSFLPLIRQEAQQRGWLDETDYLDALAFGNALPGPIATKLAGYVGYKVAGALGSAVALAALTVPTIVAVVALGGLFARYESLPAVRGVLTGIRPVVFALVLLVVFEFFPAALGLRRSSQPAPQPASAAPHPPRGEAVKRLLRLLLALAAFAVAVGTGVHPGLLIVVGGLLGIVIARLP